MEVGSGRYEEGKGEKDGELHAFRVESAKTALQGRGGEGSFPRMVLKAPGPGEGRGGQTSSRTHHTGRARETVRGVAREAHVGLSTGCARFLKGAND